MAILFLTLSLPVHLNVAIGKYAFTGMRVVGPYHRQLGNSNRRKLGQQEGVSLLGLINAPSVTIFMCVPRPVWLMLQSKIRSVSDTMYT